ncbi:xanthine dehydrogenase subunit XdhA [Escherichia coli]|uniref:Xanthine dehydrogenase subunit XdhA n=1 Tax=Escherichia coli TaxID=562 RepID=A0A377CXZ3_ECOLX|nr:xanthine dehydrogenase subunit XdhA [Escherichia coli]
MLKAAWSRNPNLLDYKMPTMPDLPQLESAFVEINEPHPHTDISHWVSHQ